MRCADDKLRGAGLSRNKMLALRDLSAKTLDGTLPMLDELHALDDETIVEKLTSVRGIGRWTVEMLLIFRLGRADVLPVDDFGVRKGLHASVQQAADADTETTESLRHPQGTVSQRRQLVFVAAADETKSAK
jgi:3-methyladenine DNA glycosylase/8-oxoguanine DNA glycosylase